MPRASSVPRPTAVKPPPPSATRAAIYVRVSTEDQARDGYGLDVQRERCRAMAIVKGWEIRQEYADEGISGTKDASARPGLAALLLAVQQGEVGAVIVLALDRLGRKTRIILDLVDAIVEAGAELVSCKESLDTTTPAGRFVLTIFAALAQLERDNIVERTSSGRDQRGRRDGEKGGRLPYGYVRAPEGVAIDEQAAAVVRRIFHLARQGATLRAIARALEAPGPRGGQWHASSVSEILANESAYRGGARGESTVCWPQVLC